MEEGQRGSSERRPVRMARSLAPPILQPSDSKKPSIKEASPKGFNRNPSMVEDIFPNYGVLDGYGASGS